MGGSSNIDEVLDLMEATAIIVIPLFLKVAYMEESYNDQDNGENPIGAAATDKTSINPLPQGDMPPPTDLLEDCAKIILHDVLVGSRQESGVGTITTDFVRNILSMYGEDELAADQTLLEEMVEAIIEDIFFHNRIRIKSIHSADATIKTERFKTLNSSLVIKKRRSLTANNIGDTGYSTKTTPPSLEVDTDGGVETSLPGKKRKRPRLLNIHEEKRVYTAPAVDILAGTYHRSKVLLVFLWCATVYGLFSLTWIRKPFGVNQVDVKCDKLYGEKGSIANSKCRRHFLPRWCQHLKLAVLIYNVLFLWNFDN